MDKILKRFSINKMIVQLIRVCRKMYYIEYYGGVQPILAVVVQNLFLPRFARFIWGN